METNCTVVTPSGQHFRGQLGEGMNWQWFEVILTKEDAIQYLGYPPQYGKPEIHFPVVPHHIIPDDTVSALRIMIWDGLSEPRYRYSSIDAFLWHKDYYASPTPTRPTSHR